MVKMKHLLLATTVAAGIALAGGSAYAADLAKPGVVEAPAPAAMSGVYVSVFGGYAVANDVDGTTTQGGFDVAVPFNSGYTIGGAIGTHVAPNLRAEAEVSYVSRNASDSPFASGGVTGTVTGSSATLYVLGNIWYDLDMGGSITPYLGGGVGAAVIMPNLVIDTGAPYTTDSWALAGQLGAGVKFQVADNMSLDLGYRAKGVFNASITGTAPGSDMTNVHFIDQTVQVGLTVGF